MMFSIQETNSIDCSNSSAIKKIDELNKQNIQPINVYKEVFIYVYLHDFVDICYYLLLISYFYTVWICTRNSKYDHGWD